MNYRVFYISTAVIGDNLTLFWTGHGFSPEYPDAKLFERKSEAKAALFIAQSRIGAQLQLSTSEHDS